MTTLRNFRDTYLKSTDDGKALVKEYYKIAPAIVEKIESHSKKDEILKDIYAQVCEICNMIEDEKHEDAVSAYTQMVKGVEAAV